MRGESLTFPQVTEADAPPNEAPDENHIEDLIAENLIDSLAILPEADLANALHEFVEKVTPFAPEAFLAGQEPQRILVWVTEFGNDLIIHS